MCISFENLIFERKAKLMNSAEKNWREYFEKIWEIQRKRQEKNVSEETLKEIALEAGMTESEWEEVQLEFNSYVRKGQGYLKHKNWSDALEEFEQAHQINAHSAEVLYGMAQAYQLKFKQKERIREAEKAVQFAEESLEVNPDNKAAYGFISGLKKQIQYLKRKRIRRIITLVILFLLVGVVVKYWQDVYDRVVQDAEQISEFFKTEPGTTFTLNEVIFQEGQTGLDENAQAELDRLANFLLENPQIVGEVSGHTDNTGDTNFNQQLSEQRAKICYDYLISKGIPESRLVYKGYGDSRPKVSNTSEENRAKNRRIEFKILK